MELERIPLADLVPFDDNPRTITDEGKESLRQSLEAFGLFKPLLAWRDETGRPVVIGGNQRLNVLIDARESGHTVPDVVPVVWFTGDRNDARVVAMRDNNSDGVWDFDALPSFMAEIGDMVDSSLTGFNPETIADLQHIAAEIADLENEEQRRAEADGDDTLRDRVPKPVQDYAGDRFVRFAVGNVRGKLPMDAYGRWLQVFDGYCQHLNTTDVSAVVAAMVEDMEGNA